MGHGTTENNKLKAADQNKWYYKISIPYVYILCGWGEVRKKQCTLLKSSTMNFNTNLTADKKIIK